jgi:hypothetical protein
LRVVVKAPTPDVARHRYCRYYIFSAPYELAFAVVVRWPVVVLDGVFALFFAADVVLHLKA